MKYGLLPGGKKIRSKILIDVGFLLSVDYKTLITVGQTVIAGETLISNPNNIENLNGSKLVKSYLLDHTCLLFNINSFDNFVEFL